LLLGSATGVLLAFLSSTGTSLNFTPDEHAASAPVKTKIQRLRLIIDNSKITN
jgi:hypothetical protein